MPDFIVQWLEQFGTQAVGWLLLILSMLAMWMVRQVPDIMDRVADDLEKADEDNEGPDDMGAKVLRALVPLVRSIIDQIFATVNPASLFMKKPKRLKKKKGK